jgi:hypothetical protein
MQRVCGLARLLGTNIIRSEGGTPKDSVPKEKWLDAMHGCFSRCVEFLDKPKYRNTRGRFTFPHCTLNRRGSTIFR